MFVVRLLLNRRKKNHFGLYYCFWTISNWVSHDSLSSYRRLLINGFFFSIYILAIAMQRDRERRKKRTHTDEIVTIYTFKYAHQFTAIVLIKRPLFENWVLMLPPPPPSSLPPSPSFIVLLYHYFSLSWSSKAVFLIHFIIRKKWEKYTFSTKMLKNRMKQEITSIKLLTKILTPNSSIYIDIWITIKSFRANKVYSIWNDFTAKSTRL